jgi:hypothetical protein
MDERQIMSMHHVDVRGARKILRARQGKGDNAVSVIVERNRREQNVGSGNRNVSLTDDATLQAESIESRLDTEPGDSLLFRAAHLQQRVHAAVQGAVGKDDLIHAVVIGVQEFLGLSDRDAEGGSPAF